MRIIFLVALLNFTVKSLGQVFVIDRGSEEIEKLNTAVSALAWMEMNKPDRIMEYLSRDSRIDHAFLERECNYISENFPFEDGIPGFVSNKEKDLLWYQRTYFRKSEKEFEASRAGKLERLVRRRSMRERKEYVKKLNQPIEISNTDLKKAIKDIIRKDLRNSSYNILKKSWFAKI